MTVVYNEIDPFAAQWLRNLIDRDLIEPGEVIETDILRLRADQIRYARQAHFFAGIGIWSYALRLAGWPADVPVWSGSCPCQPYSVAGKGLGADDPRNLWPAWLRLIDECRPPVIFGEQVASPAGRRWLGSVQTDLEALGYRVGRRICALRASVPRTSGKDSSSSAWQTPKAKDWKTGWLKGRSGLNDQAIQFVGWKTPIGNDATGSDYAYSRGDHSKKVWKLPGEAKLADSGPQPTGSTAETKKPGQLNPDHSRWLMGLPAEWLLACPRDPVKRKKSTTGEGRSRG